jgi:preprotein translocase subunit SecB
MVREKQGANRRKMFGRPLFEPAKKQLHALEEKEMANPVGNGAPEPNKAVPRFSMLTQYTKDFSFENPNAPRTLAAQQQSPKISLQINVNARQIGPGDFEVSLMLEGGAGEGAEALFKFELNYSGVFRVENIPQEQIQPLVMIEGPRLLFPFARQIVADSVRGGGYPPLYVDPIDFHGLYMQRLAATTAGATPVHA